MDRRAVEDAHESPWRTSMSGDQRRADPARPAGLHRKTPLALIVIDYLQLMTEAKGTNRNEQLSNVTRGLKLLARELGSGALHCRNCPGRLRTAATSVRYTRPAGFRRPSNRTRTW